MSVRVPELLVTQAHQGITPSEVTPRLGWRQAVRNLVTRPLLITTASHICGIEMRPRCILGLAGIYLRRPCDS